MSTQDNTMETSTSEREVSVFEKSLNWYIQQMNALIDSMPIVLRVLATNAIMRADKLKAFLKEQGVDSRNESSLFPIEQYGHYEQLLLNAEQSVESTLLYPCNMVVSFVSIYDAFVGNLIKALYLTTPEKLNECCREISIKELLQFASIDEAKAHIVEKEAETVLRSSHIEQLEWFGKKLKTSFTDFPSYSKFVEITERRNLYVHTNGTVSGQYLSVCKKVGVEGVSKIKIGDRLPALPEYVIDCYNTLFEVGVKLGIIIWRKLKKGDECADDYLNQVCYDLLKQEKYDLAKVMLRFATDTIKDPVTDEIRRYFIINKALAHYLTGDKSGCNAIIKKEDWSASAAKFQLAIAVLNENYKLAASTMEEVKPNIPNIAYYEWPLFKNFRKSEEFKSEYQRLYGQDFEYNEPQKENSEEIFRYAIDIRDRFKYLADEELKTYDSDNTTADCIA